MRRFSLEGEDYVHAQTGFRFPARAGALIRKSVTEYTANRDDVSVDYDLPGAMPQTVHVSAYVFPIWNMAERRITMDDVPNACATAYGYAIDQMRQYAVNPRLSREETIPPGRFPGATLHMTAVYDADGSAVRSTGPIRTSLTFHCAVNKVWIVMYRVTGPQDFDADDKLQELMNLVPVKPAS